jgi:adenylate kinase family enzyme
MQAGSVVMISGPSGAGKSSVARQLALGSPRERTVHLHTDDFYAAIVKGFIEPFRPEAHAQNIVVVEAFTACAKRFAQGGFEVVVDGVVGPWFIDRWQALAREGFDVHYIVLRPDEPTTLARATARTSPDALTDPHAIRQIREGFANLGPFEPHALDSTALSLAATVAQVRAHVNGRTRLLAGATERAGSRGPHGTGGGGAVSPPTGPFR